MAPSLPFIVSAVFSALHALALPVCEVSLAFGVKVTSHE